MEAELDAQTLADWALENGLERNISKIRVIIVGSDAYLNLLKNRPLPEIKMNGTAIPYYFSVKNKAATTEKLSIFDRESFFLMKTRFATRRGTSHQLFASRAQGLRHGNNPLLEEHGFIEPPQYYKSL